MFFFFFFKQKTAYEIGTGDWSSDVCSSDLVIQRQLDRSELTSNALQLTDLKAPPLDRHCRAVADLPPIHPAFEYRYDLNLLAPNIEKARDARGGVLIHPPSALHPQSP